MDGQLWREKPTWCGCKSNMTSCAPAASAVGRRVNESLFCESCCPVPPSRSLYLCCSHAWCPLLFSNMPVYTHTHSLKATHTKPAFTALIFCCNKPLKSKQCITMNPFILPVTKRHLFCCVCWTFCSLSKRRHCPILGHLSGNGIQDSYFSEKEAKHLFLRP